MNTIDLPDQSKQSIARWTIADHDETSLHVVENTADGMDFLFGGRPRGFA